jgi:catechol 2,3-dioxygenase-like lactoylglutathione lyase family enzyme
MDNVGIVVEDLDAAIEFFTELGLTLEGRGSVEGPLVARLTALEGAASDIAMLEIPGGGRIELSQFRAPLAEGDPTQMINVPGMRHLCFAVDDLEDTRARLEAHGAELIGEVVDYEGAYLLCYLRGPDGIIVELAEKRG